MKRRLLLALALATMAISTARAAFTEDYNATYLDMRCGMPGNYVDDMLQDSFGFVWICNYGGGLLRYDGYTFQQPLLGRMERVMGSFSCRNACEDRFQRLWVTFDEGTLVLNLRTLQSTTPTYKQRDINYILHQPAVKVACDADGNIWLVTRTRIYYIRCDGEGEITEVLESSYHGNVPDIVLKDLYHNGSMVASIDQGLYQLRPRGGRLTKQPLASELGDMSGNYITDVAHHDHRTWVSTNNGLYSVDDRTRQVSHYTSSLAGNGKSLSHNHVTCLMPLDADRLLAGTLHGVNIMNTRDETFTTWNAAINVNPLSSDYVSCIMLRGGQIWVGTETGGIVKLTPRELDLRSWVHDGTAGSLAQGCVNAMHVDTDGTLWVGTVDGGLSRRAAGCDTFTHFTTRNSPLPHNSVSTLMADAHGHLWVGTWGGGVCTVSLKNPSDMKQLSVADTMRQRINFIGALAYDSRNDGVWIGANEGLYFYNLARQRLEEPFTDCRNIRGCIGSIVERDGTLWVGCTEGAVEVNLRKPHMDSGGHRTFSHTQHRYRLDQPDSRIIEKFSCFLQTHDGTLWLGSNEYGLYQRVRDKRGKTSYKTYTVLDGLANNSVKGLVEDSEGMIWITTNNGLSRLNPQTGAFTNYTDADGLLSCQFYWNSAIISPSDDIYLGTTQGLIELVGMNITAEKEGQLRFTQLTVDNQGITSDGKFVDGDISTAKRIRLHEWNKSVEVSFSALNYDHERSAIYTYRLRGFDDGWQQLPAGQHSVRYTNLPSGNYTLEVRLALANSRDDADTLSIAIHIVPYFYKQPWFIVLALLAAALALAYIYKRHTRVLRRREADSFLEPIRQTLTDTSEPQQLRRRIQSIIDNQKLYQQSYERTARDNDKQTLQKTEPFMVQVMRIMERNYMDSDFGVTQLSEQMGMTRAMLAKKMNMETGQSTSKFICSYRLNIAHELLLKNSANRNIAEIAFSVGFNDPKYFTRCFTREYGVSPSKLA